jgi:hypothetical protein
MHIETRTGFRTVHALLIAGALIASAGYAVAGSASKVPSGQSDAKGTIARKVAAGEPLAGVINGLVKGGMPIDAVVTAAVQAGADPAKVAYAAVSEGHDARRVVQGTIQAGARPDGVIKAAIDAGGDRRTVQTAARDAGVSASTIANVIAGSPNASRSSREGDRGHQTSARGDWDGPIVIPSHDHDFGGGGGAPPCNEPASPHKPNKGHGRWGDHFNGRGNHYGWDNDHGNDNHHGRPDTSRHLTRR